MAEKVEKKVKAAEPAAEAAPKKGGKKAAKPVEAPAEETAQAKKGGAKGKKAAVEEKPKDEIKYIVRIANADLDGTSTVQYALTGIHGIGIRCSKILSRKAEVDPNAIMGYLPPEQVERLKNVVENFEANIPLWMLNRRRDVYTGEDKHLTGIDLTMGIKEDINLMKKMRSYKGLRHERGQKVRGQRTKSTGRTGAIVGVVRKKEAAKK
ncbi:30S ribosomal protein S13 [Methanocella sp. CWC-04]|uniref:Small ribosomal subunit protein uS13 n=1 Tax=Methanooceanicella nereidis TaxID=2052831 RepID=A0AAP2RA15_9EURY|nr:30S ribosomal protein S13 [Methanocella sp. CWC-04]MCD1293483.1 30S ribosomal protein S13 [Methanocella sp. CWC-04]